MKKLHIIMPMGGLGTRTSVMYKTPKPFIRLYDKMLFEYPLSGFDEIRHKVTTKLTIVTRSRILNDYYIKNINKIGWNFADKFNIITIDELTRGSLETVMKTEHLIEDDDICVVLDCDLIFKYDNLYNLISDIDENELYDGFLLSFNSDSNKYSYATTGDNNIVTRTAEKDPISNHALAGVYGFASGKMLKKYATEILNNPSEYNEYYVSAVYNHMIDDGARIYLGNLDEYASIGTAEEIEQFKSYDNKFKKLYISDLDGTLIDTKEANCLAYQETFKKVYDYDMQPEEYYENFGLRINELIEKLGFDITKLSDVKRTKSRIYKKYFDRININIQLVAELYHKKKAGHTIALATTASRKNVENILNYFDIDDLFDFVLASEDVKNGKPNPEVYNKIIEHFPFVSNINTYIFEDSDVGILAAHKTVVPDSNIIDINKVTMHKNFVDKDTFINKRQITNKF